MTLDLRLNPHWFAAEDYLCTRGEFQTAHYRSARAPVTPHILTIGHPRLNLAHPYFASLFEQETRHLRTEYGPFVLINTNFSVGNHALYEACALEEERIAPDNRKMRNYYIDHYAYCAAKLPRFIQLASQLSDALPDHRIIFRPHPSENLRVYQAMARFIPRMKVLTGGSLLAWLHAAEVLIHSGCTTAVEGWIAGTRIINFQPVPGKEFVQRIPDLIGIRAETCAEVVEKVRARDALDREIMLPAADHSRVMEVLANVDESDQAFLRLRDLVWHVQETCEAPRVLGNLAPFRRRGRAEKIKALLRKVSPWRMEKMDTRKAYRRRRFGGLPPSMIEPKLEAINRLLGTSLKAEYVSSKLIRLHTS